VGARLVAGLVAAVAALTLAAGCGGDDEREAIPEEVVRAWSAALNAGDDEAAADLFAANATVSQPGYIAQLPTREDAVAFNRSLPCSGQIVELTTIGDQVTATFLLGDRPASPCDGPGELVTAVFVVEDGKIVVWQQIPTPADEPGGGGIEA
jgi:limonene-1,2-epoxide hydrolase